MQPSAPQNDVSQVYKEIIRTLIAMLDHKGAYYKIHAEQVAATCVRFASKLGMPRDFMDTIYLAAMVYDLGMIYVPDDIIDKAGSLTPQELALVRQHPFTARQILINMSHMRDIIPIVRQHHEAYDGEGYPDKLDGPDIHIGARILSIVDSYEAMITDRPYRDALNKAEALEQIRSQIGKKFDPRVSEAFIKFIMQQDAPESGPDHADAESAGMHNQASDEEADALEAPKSVHTAVLEVGELFKKGELELPVFPTMIQKVRDALNASVSPDFLASIIDQDEVIAQSIIHVANSEHYGGNGKIPNVKQAVSRLGMKETRDIVSAFALKTIYSADKQRVKTLMEKLWMHSLTTAYMARALAIKVSPKDAEALFLLGLTHDIGKVLLLHAISKILFKKGATDEADMDDLVGNIQSIHAGFGAALLKRWGFADDMVTIVAVHEKPDISPRTPHVLLMLYLANMLTRRIGYSLFTDPEALDEPAQLLGIDLPFMQEIMKEAINFVQSITNQA